jgi:peptidase E
MEIIILGASGIIGKAVKKELVAYCIDFCKKQSAKILFLKPT